MRTNHKPAPGSLESRLRAERPVFPAPDGFTERVMESLGRQEPRPRTPVRRLPALSIVFALTGAACALFIAVKFAPASRPTTGGQQLADALSNIQFPEISAARVQALTARLDEPLEAELRNVISDTRQAIQFVASNFLPEN